MRIRLTLLLVLLAFLLLSAGALAALPYQAETGTLAGGDYQLTTFGSRAGGDYLLTTFGSRAGNVAAGGGYRLLGPAAPELRGSGCCCSYLPCTLRSY